MYIQMHTRGRSGFSLVELMVVAVIVAILAVVAIPLMSGNKKRAMATEAEAALGTIRSQLRVMFAETGAYNKHPSGYTIGNAASVTNVPGIRRGDLNGKYFVDGSYVLTTMTSNSYLVTASGTGEVAGVTITINQLGVLGRKGL